jgi:hypothetical protein
VQTVATEKVQSGPKVVRISVLKMRFITLNFPIHSIKVANRSFEDVAELKRLGTTLMDQNCVHKEIKSRLNSGNACYHSV